MCESASVGPESDIAKTAQLQPLRGFDRLSAAGFSESDIANFRRQFHSQSASRYLDTDFDTEEECVHSSHLHYLHYWRRRSPDDEHARALEEQWIDSLDNASTASLSQSSSSTNSSVLQGIVLGFFFPLLPFFFIREPKPAAFWDSGTEHELTGSVVFS